MDVRLDPLAEPMRCPHGSEFIALSNGVAEWLTPCNACEKGTVSVGGRALAAA